MCLKKKKKKASRQRQACIDVWVGFSGGCHCLLRELPGKRGSCNYCNGKGICLTASGSGTTRRHPHQPISFSDCCSDAGLTIGPGKSHQAIGQFPMGRDKIRNIFSLSLFPMFSHAFCTRIGLGPGTLTNCPAKQMCTPYTTCSTVVLHARTIVLCIVSRPIISEYHH